MSDLANELRSLCADECRNRIDYRCVVCRAAEVVEQMADVTADNERLWQFVAERPCECRGEFPNKCDRCTLIESAKG